MSNSPTPRERLEDSLKTPYDSESDYWSALLDSLEGEFVDHESVLDDVEQNKFIDTADAPALERLASIFDIERRQNETLDEFRGRLKTALRSQITSGTVTEIREVVAVILGTDIEEIGLDEPYDFLPAFIELELPSDFEENISPGALIDIVREVTAAGVDIGIRVTVDATSVVLFDDSVTVGPSDDDVTTDTTAITDAHIIPSSDQTVQPDATALDDAHRVATDAVEELFWDEGKWGINIWTGFTDLPDEFHVETVLFSDGSSVSVPDAQTELAAIADTAVGETADAVVEQLTPSDKAVLTGHETEELFYNNGKMGFDIWTSTTRLADEVTEYFYDEGLWSYGVWTAVE